MAEKVREASARGDTVQLKRLLDDGVKPLPDEHGRSPLQIAAAAGHADICEILLRSRVDVNAADTTGMTPLQRAAAEGHLEVVKVLLKYNADISRQDNIHGNSALHEASWRGFSHTVAALAKALGTQRGPLHTRNHAGFAPLHLACQNGHNQSCRELLLAGCNPDLQNNYGDTPLHTSARYGHAGVTRILISALCKVSDQNKNGDTALHIAAAMGRRKLTRILLEVSCNYALRNKQGETAKDIAKRKNLIEILDIFTKYRQKPSASSSKTKTTSSPIHKSSKTPGNRESDKKTKKSGSKVHFSPSKPAKEWSPYGCHYYPDPEAFPQPKLDSLPPDPLARGEQYYLDLGGNIRKGPVGVGYTCYCAPFFRHMEAKLERDKAELKAHIDQAHERLDLKVAHLEKKTRNQINELTRCVAADKLDCQGRHEHLRRWLNRGGHGRHSERILRQDRAGKRDEPARARSLEDLLDEKDEERSFEIPGETSAHRSLDNLDIPPIPRLSKSLKDLASDETRPKESPKLNETFDGVIGRDRTSPLGAAASPTVSLRSSAFKNGQQAFRTHEERDMAILEDDKEAWKISNSRRSVHEMIKRFQQGTTLHSAWRRTRSIGSGSNLSSEHSQCGAGHRVQPQGTSPNGWHEGQENESESSEAEDDGEDSKQLNGIGHKLQRGIPSGPHYDSIAKMPYRSRSAVYSPTPPLNDVHNDSGYSTRMYGSSKGASPSLSGQLECDVILPPARNHFPSGKQLSALLEQPRGHDLTVYERGADNVVINIGAASLV